MINLVTGLLQPTFKKGTSFYTNAIARVGDKYKALHLSLTLFSVFQRRACFKMLSGSKVLLGMEESQWLLQNMLMVRHRLDWLSFPIQHNKVNPGTICNAAKRAQLSRD